MIFEPKPSLLQGDIFKHHNSNKKTLDMWDDDKGIAYLGGCGLGGGGDGGGGEGGGGGEHRGITRPGSSGRTRHTGASQRAIDQSMLRAQKVGGKYNSEGPAEGQYQKQRKEGMAAVAD